MNTNASMISRQHSEIRVMERIEKMLEQDSTMGRAKTHGSI